MAPLHVAQNSPSMQVDFANAANALTIAGAV